MWTALVWLRIGTSESIFLNMILNFRFSKVPETSWLTKWQLAFEADSAAYCLWTNVFMITRLIGPNVGMFTTLVKQCICCYISGKWQVRKWAKRKKLFLNKINNYIIQLRLFYRQSITFRLNYLSITIDLQNFLSLWMSNDFQIQ